MKINNRLKIVLLATLFNLSFEYSLRGASILFTKPQLFISLVVTYFALYSMVEDLIVRLKLKDYQVLLLTSIYMMVYMAFITGVIFEKPYFLGINPVNLIFVGILWSGIIQGPLTFYFANRIQARDWNHPKMSTLGWSLCLLTTIFVWIIHYLGNPYKAIGLPVGYLIWGLSEAFLVVLLFLTIKKNKSTAQVNFVKSPVLDFLAFGTFFIFLFSLFFLTRGQFISVATEVNRPALVVVNLWTVFLSTILTIFRLKKGPIPI